MKGLKELVYVVNKNKIKRIELLDLNDDNSSKVNQLYQAISEGLVNSDEEAFDLLFDKKQSKSGYRNLKATLYNKLLNTIFFIDAYQNKNTDRQIAYYESYKDFAAVQIMLAKHARRAGISLFEKILKKAEKFEFIDLLIPVARSLRMYYGTQEGEGKKYNHYDSLLRHYQEVDRLESLAEEYYSNLVMHFVNKKSKTAELQALAHQYAEDLRKNIDKKSSYKYYFYTALIELFEHTCVNDYVSTIEMCDRIIAFFEQKPYSANTPIQICLHHQLVAYLQLREFGKGEQVARKSQLLIEEGSFNWFKNLEYLFLLAMHTANYQKGYEIYHEAISHKGFTFLPESIQEMWNLYQAYLHLLVDQGMIALEEGDKHFTTFRINRFLNEMPTYSKDKRGMNIAILVVQIIFYIQKKKYDAAIDRMEAIEKYCSRYLFKEDTMRSYYFIQLLLTIIQASFHLEAVNRYAKKPLAKLMGISTEISNQFHKIEIIPYEDLWKLALSMLETKTVRLRRLNEL
jgi:hypothetical protein